MFQARWSFDGRVMGMPFLHSTGRRSLSSAISAIPRTRTAASRLPQRSNSMNARNTHPSSTPCSIRGISLNDTSPPRVAAS